MLTEARYAFLPYKLHCVTKDAKWASLVSALGRKQTKTGDRYPVNLALSQAPKGKAAEQEPFHP